MSSAFLINAVVLFAGVVAFVVAGFAGTFVRGLQTWRYRLLLAPLGFVVAGGIGISAEAHLVRWLQHGHSHPTLLAGLFQTAVLLLTGCAGMLAGVGLGSSLDRNFPDAPTYTIANYWQRNAPGSPLVDKVIPISEGRRRPQPGILPAIKAISNHD